MLDDPAIYRLLDNRWLVTILKQVDGQYLAFARRPGQSVKKVLPQVGLDPDNHEKLIGISDGIPRQNATAATPSEACAKLAESVFGLGASIETTEG